MGELEPNSQLPDDISFSQGLCLKAMLGLVRDKDVLAAECPLRRNGYTEASLGVYGSIPIEMDCAKQDCDNSAVLQIEDGNVTIVSTSL